MQKYYKFHNSFIYIVFWCISAFLTHVPVLLANEKIVIIIRSNQVEAYNEAIEGFKEGCEEKNISIKEVYDLNGDIEEGKKAIRNIEIGKQSPNLILAVGILAATLAKERFTDIPVIFCMVIYHERFNLRGPNITGISTEVPLEKQFMILKKIPGKNKNIGVLYDPANTEKIISKAFHVAKRSGLNLITREIGSEKGAASVLEELINKIDILWIMSDSTVITKDTLDIILMIASRHRLPTFCNSSVFAKAGVLVSISPDYKYIGYQAAIMAQTLLNNPTVVSLGIGQPDKLNLFLNTQTANTIGIDISSFKSWPNPVLCP